ncbi:MAG TPA: hypothetical protein PKE26_15275 [Kiritimatiellia bacterium]|nr:hypothetical protein [Kiritimatiellia bacterium]HMP00457.1 hypothetical protein [Kiritimatiellia bacterium]
MDDLEKYIQRRKKRSKKFADGFEVGYEQFKIGVMLRVAREEAGLTQDDVANRLNMSTRRGLVMPKRPRLRGRELIAILRDE